MSFISKKQILDVIKKVNHRLDIKNAFQLITYEPDDYCQISYTKLPPEYIISISFNPTNDWMTPIVGWIYNKTTDDELCFETNYLANQASKMIAHFLLALRNKTVQKKIRQFIKEIDAKTQTLANRNTEEKRKAYDELDKRFWELSMQTPHTDEIKTELKKISAQMRKIDPSGDFISKKVKLPIVIHLDQILADES